MLLEHSHTHSLMYCLWLFLCYNSRTEKLQQSLYGLHGIAFHRKTLLTPVLSHHPICFLYAMCCHTYNHLAYFFGYLLSYSQKNGSSMRSGTESHLFISVSQVLSQCLKPNRHLMFAEYINDLDRFLNVILFYSFHWGFGSRMRGVKYILSQLTHQI